MPTKNVKKSISTKCVKQDKRCLICSDLDGTLLNSKSMIPDYTRNVIQTLSKKGHIFCIITARPKRSSFYFYRLLDLKTPLCNYNGACINNPTDPLFDPIHLCINKDIIIKLFTDKTIMSMATTVMVETIAATYFYNPKKYTTAQLRGALSLFNIYTSDNILYLDKDWHQLKHGAFSVLVALKDQSKIEDFKREIKKRCNSIIVRSWTEEHVGTIVEINSTFPSKGAALEYLASYYDIPKERCYAFGDNENDIEMFEAAGHSFAMKNGLVIAKNHAQNVTQYANFDEGVGRELNKVFKLGLKYKKSDTLEFDVLQVKD